MFECGNHLSPPFRNESLQGYLTGKSSGSGSGSGSEQLRGAAGRVVYIFYEACCLVLMGQ